MFVWEECTSFVKDFEKNHSNTIGNKDSSMVAILDVLGSILPVIYVTGYKNLCTRTVQSSDSSDEHAYKVSRLYF